MKSLFLIGAACAAFALAGCGGGNENAATDDDGAPPAAAAETGGGFASDYATRVNHLAELLEGVNDAAGAEAVKAQIETEAAELNALVKAEAAKPDYQATAVALLSDKGWMDANTRLARAMQHVDSTAPELGAKASMASNGAL